MLRTDVPDEAFELMKLYRMEVGRSRPGVEYVPLFLLRKRDEVLSRSYMPRFIPAFQLFVVIRHITYRRWRTFLSVGAVALASGQFIIFVSHSEWLSGFSLQYNLQISSPHHSKPVEGKDYLHLYRGIIDTASSIPGVFAVSPTLATTVTLVHKNKAENVAMIGIDP